jgi:hypothetical protein
MRRSVAPYNDTDVRFNIEHTMVTIRPCTGRRRVLTRDRNLAVIGMRECAMPTIERQRKAGLRFLKSFTLGAKGIMRLAMVEPEGSYNGDQISFDCKCGFYYQQSERARQGR